jgi:singapore isolate B (sub-type 7) whole genome shotgun sequence assembly, scaffold_0
MFKGWAEIARKNVTENGFDDVITVINKHSSSLVVKSAAHPDDYGLIVLSL